METMKATLVKLMPQGVDIDELLRQAKLKAEHDRQLIFDKYRAAYPTEYISDYFIREIKLAERQEKPCGACRGVPCKKDNADGFRHKVIPFNGELTLTAYRCPFVLRDAQQKRAAGQFQRAKIPAKYAGKTMADYRVDAGNAKAVKFYEYALKEVVSLFYYGNPGVGKTFLTAILAQDYLKAGRSVIFADVPSLLADLRTSFAKDSEKNIEDQLRLLSEVDVLFLDDLGAEMATEWAVEQLYLIINARYSGNRQIVVTSNHSLDEIADILNNPKNSKREGITGSRIASRLKQMCKVCGIGGGDKRLVNR